METAQKVSFCCSVSCLSCSGASTVAGIFPLISSAMSYISWRLLDVFQVIQCSRFDLTNTNSIRKHVIPWLDKQILRLVVHLTSTKNIAISDSLMLPEGPCFGLLCVDNGRSGSQESVAVFLLRLSHTANYWSRSHPLSPHTHTPTPCTKRVATSAHLLTGSLKTSWSCMLVHAVILRYHPVGTEVAAQ